MSLPAPCASTTTGVRPATNPGDASMAVVTAPPWSRLTEKRSSATPAMLVRASATRQMRGACALPRDVEPPGGPNDEQRSADQASAVDRAVHAAVGAVLGVVAQHE